ncbi:flippase [Xenorhabdus bovienii]|uniref:flippase n=1 Tax=Xenorhabdus bovienii TaxID=40576 RepID=UPI0023B26863|nr:flippase [Xenorhabdus bovienii]MDE9481665.1 flippase [Xenorhabdus bovienii]MDE9486659.1 flippase [Xenorhabdus bovienii]
MNINTKLNKNILYLTLVQGSIYILPLVTFPYLVRILGVENFGILAFCLATIQYLVLITDYGFNLTASQKIAKIGNNKILVSKTFWSVTNAKFLLAILSLLLLVIIIMEIKIYQDKCNILIALSPLFLGNVIYPIWLFQGKEDMKWITFCSVISRLIVIPLTFFFVKNKNDIVIAALIQSSPNFIAGIISLSIIYKYKWVGKIELNLSEVQKRLKESWHVFLSTSAISLYTTSIIIILGFISGPIAVGYFNAANTIRNAAQGLLNPIAQAIYPRINNLITENYEEALSLLKKSLRYFCGLALLGSILLYILAPYLIKYGLGSEYSESINVLRWLAFVPFIVSLSNIFGIQTMLSHNYKKQFSNILMICGAISILLAFPMIYIFNKDGSAISILISESLVTLSMYIFLRKKNINLFKK